MSFRIDRSGFVGIAALGLVFAAAMPATSASLMDLGVLPGATTSEAYAVSSDGRTVVGRAEFPTGSQAFRWDAVHGMIGLGDLDGGPVLSSGMGVSGDGSIVVGVGYRAGYYEAFRWDASTGMVGLGDLPGGNVQSDAYGISADGTTIVGSSSSATGLQAFRWTAGEGMIGLGDLPGGDGLSVARGISADASVIVGFSSSSASFSGATEMFRWEATSGMLGFGDIPGGAFDSSGYAVSGDGTIVVGDGTSADRFPEVVIYSPATGIIGLGVNGAAYAASADGSIVVGRLGGQRGDTAFIWDATHGLRDLKSVLAGLGLDVTGWTLSQARGISADGTTIVGIGGPIDGSGAFIAVIPEPGSSLLIGLGLAVLALRSRRFGSVLTLAERIRAPHPQR